MIQTFVEQNRRLLKTCCLAAKIFGWLALSMGCLATVGHSFALISRIGDWAVFQDYFRNDVPWNVIQGIAIGLLALGIGQFIRFVYDSDYQPNWVLRNAKQLLYIYAVVFGISLMIHCIMAFPHWNHWAEITIRLLGIFIYGAGTILLLVGLALILKRIMPVIEESKTLV